MKKFLESLNYFIGVDNYFTFFENEDVDGSGPWMVADIVFGFTYIKLLDCALKYSKNDVLEEFKKNNSTENLMDMAVYPTGETLGFYNSSEYDLDKLCESGVDIYTKMNDYMEGFSDNVKEVFDALKFEEVLEFLEKTEMTYNVLNMFNEGEIAGDYYSSYDKFMKMFSEFIKNIWHDEIYNFGRDRIATYDANSSYHYIHEALDEYGSFLNDLLLMNKNFENNENIKIYDPDSSGTYILNNTKELIESLKRNSGNFEGEVEIYGKSKRQENEIIYLAKKSVAKKDPYEVENATILDMDEDIFTLEGIEKYSDFDLIVSNYLYNGLTEYKDILEEFKNDITGNTKLVMALENLDDFIEDLAEIIKKDNLESIISFKNHYIIIANLEKSDDEKGHFLLIEESDAEQNDETVKKENREAFSNNEYDIFNAPQWKTLTQSDRKKMKTIINSYNQFKDSDDSILIKNEEYDSEMIRILLN